MSKETKIRIPLWIYPSTEEKINQNFKADNCRSQSEFIEKAIKFYIGYLSEEDNINYLSPMITETVKAQIKVRSSGFQDCFLKSPWSLGSCRI